VSAGLFAAALLALGAVYAGLIGAAAWGLRRALRRPTPRPAADPPFVSVVVPARDEAAVIEGCLRAILASDYPADRFEVIVVDDLSDDATPALVEHVAERVNAPAVLAGGFEEEDEDEGPARLRLLRMPENLERARAHKKRAIEKGIAHARGPLILTTDADCVVPPTWIATMAACFPDATVPLGAGRVTAFVSGPVLYRLEPSVPMQMQALEFLGLVSFGAGVIGLGHPVTCNGANVAYRKDVFDALGGFSGVDHLTSGDDELLMQKVARDTPHRVRFCSARGAAVETAGVPTLRGFLQQRRRWASKWHHYLHPGIVASLVAMYLFYAALLAGLLAAPFVPALWPAVLAALALDVVAEGVLAGQAAVHFGRARLLVWLVPTELLRVPYFVFIGLAGMVGRYEWKGRRVVR
jgi:cellulose synthase/poly-beta-1,6-N-acetylglucosamine synthase-like glycosyltransferase